TVDEYAREMVFQPLGMHSSRLGIPIEEQPAMADRIAPVHWTGHAVMARNEDGSIGLRNYHIERIHNEPWFLAKLEPGGGLRCTPPALGRFYEAMCRADAWLFQRPETVTMFTAAHRIGVPDRTLFGQRVPWGLGIQVAGGFTGTVGHRSHGHGGMAS